MFDQLYEAINGILIRMNQLSANVEQKNQEIGLIQDQLKIFEEKNQILEKTVNLLESHHKEFEKVISSNNGFPLTRVFLTMNGKNQPNIKSYAQYDYKIPESVIQFVPSSLNGDLRWDASNYRLYIGSAGEYLITGRVSVVGMKKDATMNLLVQHNDGASDYRLSSQSCSTGSADQNYVPVHYTMLMKENDYLTFKCNVTNNCDSTCTISGEKTAYTMIEVTRIA